MQETILKNGRQYRSHPVQYAVCIPVPYYCSEVISFGVRYTCHENVDKVFQSSTKCIKRVSIVSKQTHVQYCGSGSRIQCIFDPWIREPGSGMGKNSGSGSGMGNPDHIFESLETIIWVKILKFSVADPG
jgi:hypothetical protein